MILSIYVDMKRFILPSSEPREEILQVWYFYVEFCWSVWDRLFYPMLPFFKAFEIMSLQTHVFCVP